MKKHLYLWLCMAVSVVNGQMPVNMLAQPRYTYSENFSAISSWTFANGGTGVFVSGDGANHWKGNAAGGTGTIPNGTRITTSTTNFSGSENSGGLHRGQESLVLLTTGTSDNTSSAAIDLHLNFSGLRAGLLSFDWTSINNSSGNRKGSLRVYASTDQLNFIELPEAQVLNFTNNSPTAGEISFVQLPAAFHNAPLAILRFYYSNGSGGTTGSRPKIAIDNVEITAVPAAVCTTPTVQPTGIVFSNITPESIDGSFTPPSQAPDSYLVLATTTATLTDFPEDGISYKPGDNIHDAVVVSVSGTSFTATGLSSATPYYFHVFSYNAVCSQGPLYNVASPLSGTATTTHGNLPCTAPPAQPTNLVLASNNSSSIIGNFSATTGADEHLVVLVNGSLSQLPLQGKMYNQDDSIGNGLVVSVSAATSFLATGLQPSTSYNVYVFAMHSIYCNNGPAYNVHLPLSATIATQDMQPCTTPVAQADNLSLVATNTSVNGVFDAAINADYYLVVYSTTASLGASPANGVVYQPGSTLGNGTVAANNHATSFRINNLQPGTLYFVHVFAQNKSCSGGPLYLAANPLTGATTTTVAPVYNYYFGNLHAHSRFSDGNKDNPAFTPADNYAYAKNSLCMDFLGMSDHNHGAAGMKIANWPTGFAHAQAATTSNFLALYGMEWGVTSSGGHVLVYGIDKLLGWEPNNYDIYVGKSDYVGTPETTGTTGLFRTINTWGNNAFAILAHPGSSDFNSLVQQPYNASADSAIIGSTVESGPAFSTATNYSNPASSMSYLSYYRRMLAKGYRLGPNLDHDNHYTTFGRTAYSRLAVIAPDISHNSFMQAMRNRNFYATQDCDTRISFMLNNHIMGSEVSGPTPPSITINVSDPTSAGGVATIRIMKGIHTSGVEATEVYRETSNVISFTDADLPLNETAYYYADITMDGARSVTAPIWYKRTQGEVLPIKIIAFNAMKTGRPSTNLTWSVAGDETTTKFIVERSADGVQFTTLTEVPANFSLNGAYTANDFEPLQGLNYYRLKIVAKDGQVNYSAIVVVNFGAIDDHSFTLYPNPAYAAVQLHINSTTVENAVAIVQDVLGRPIKLYNISLQKGSQQRTLDVGTIAPGTYFLTLQLKDKKISKKFVKQ